MSRTNRSSGSSYEWIRVAAIMGALGVAIGAFGAHALPGYLQRMRLDAETIAQREATFETGVRYHMYHAITLLFIAYALRKRTSRSLSFARWCFLVGVVLFSGFLYANALTGIKWLGAVVPLGGIAFIAGWISISRVAWYRDS